MYLYEYHMYLYKYIFIMVDERPYRPEMNLNSLASTAQCRYKTQAQGFMVQGSHTAGCLQNRDRI